MTASAMEHKKEKPSAMKTYTISKSM
jgi:hypothetical protein